MIIAKLREKAITDFERSLLLHFTFFRRGSKLKAEKSKVTEDCMRKEVADQTGKRGTSGELDV